MYRNWVLHISNVKLCPYLKTWLIGVQLQVVLILAADGSASAILPESTNLNKLGAPKGLFGRRDETDETVHISGNGSPSVQRVTIVHKLGYLQPLNLKI